MVDVGDDTEVADIFQLRWGDLRFDKVQFTIVGVIISFKIRAQR